MTSIDAQGKMAQIAGMNWGSLTAFTLQLARIGIAGAGTWMLATGGNATIGWGLLAISGVTAGVDVLKVANQLKTTAANAAQAASTTTQVTIQKPAVADPAQGPT